MNHAAELLLMINQMRTHHHMIYSLGSDDCASIRINSIFSKINSIIQQQPVQFCTMINIFGHNHGVCVCNSSSSSNYFICSFIELKHFKAQDKWSFELFLKIIFHFISHSDLFCISWHLEIIDGNSKFQFKIFNFSPNDRVPC